MLRSRFDKYADSKFSEVMNFIYKVMVINILYIFTVAVGLGVFTFAPATVSAYVCMKGINENKEFPLFKTYIHTFKTEYKKSMMFFLYYLITFAILGISFNAYMQFEDNFFNTLGMLVIALLILINLGSFIHILLLSVYTPKIKFKSKIKYSYLMMLYSPMLTILLVLVNVALLIFSYIFISFSFMFTFAFMAYYNIVISSKAYVKISKDNIPLEVL